MGVYLLRSYCEQKDLFKPVNLQVQHGQGSKPRVVVFDAAGALRSFLRPNKRGLLYDFHHQQSRVKSLVAAFKKAGFELVVFLDLSIPSDKLTTWYRRRVVDASTLRKLNQQLAGMPSKPALPEGLWIPPNGAIQLLGDAFQEAGCRVFYSFDDTDKEAAYWAKKNRAYAVITDDTDFLCYEGVDRIWSANIKLPSSRPHPHRAPTIRVSELQRRQLLSSLGLNQTQLQQLAGLLGNDHIKHIAKDKLQQLREANPGLHVVAALAKQVLQLQPALGGSSGATANGFAAAFGPVLPEVKALVAAAVKAVGGSSEGEPAGKQGDKASAADAAAAAAGANDTAASVDGAVDGPAAAVANVSSSSSVDPIVARLVNRAVARVVTAAERGLDTEDLTEADLDAFLEGEEFEVSHAAAEDDEADEAAEGQPGASAGADSSPAASAASQVERCKRAMQQYSLKGVFAPVVAGNGERWLLQKRHILLKAVGLEDMSKTPAHVLLQPLRLSVYAGMGLNSVTEYLCVPDEQWRSWANGRVVEVPALPPKREKRGSRSGSKAAGAGDAHVNPAVKRLVAGAFANVLGSADAAPPATTADASKPAEAAAAETEAAAEAGGSKDAAAAATDAEAATGPEDSGTAAAGDDDGIDPAVRKLVSGAIAKAINAANRAAARANRTALPYELLPKPLPTKPVELTSLLLRRLRHIDRAEQQFTKAHEKMLLLQVSHRHSLLNAMHSSHTSVSAVRLADLHAANLFLQAYSMLHTAVDGKLPRITAILHVEAFHALCQHPELVTKVQNSPSDAEVARQPQARGAATANMAAAAAAAAAAASAGRGGFRGGNKPIMPTSTGGRGLAQPYSQQYPVQQQQRGYGRGGSGYGGGRGGRGEAAPGGNPGYGYQQPYGGANNHESHAGGFRSREANFGGGYGPSRGGYHPAAPIMSGGGGGRGGGGGGSYQQGPAQHWPAPQRPQQRGEALTWQQRQNRGPSHYYPGAATPQSGTGAPAGGSSPNQASQWAGGSGSSSSAAYNQHGNAGGYEQGGHQGYGASGGSYRGQQGASSVSYSGSGYSGSGGGYGAGYGYGGGSGYGGGYGAGGGGGYQQGGYAGQHYGGYPQPASGGYGGAQHYGGQQQQAGGYGSAGRGGPAGGAGGSHRQHQSPPGMQPGGAQGSAGLTWQQQQMVREHQPARGPSGHPGASGPTRQGSGGWQ